MASHLDLEEQEQLEQLKAFWKRYGNLVTWLLTLVLGAYAAWTGWNWWQQQQAIKASGLYEEFERVAKNGEADKTAALFSELKQRYGSSTYAAQAAMQLARVQYDKGQADAARGTLAWAAESAGEPNYREIARLRLAGLQMDAKQYDEASKTLDAIKLPEYAALAADRRGDLALAQGKADVAKAEYRKAYAGLDKTVQYRNLIEAKLSSLGVDVLSEEKKAGDAPAAKGAGQ